MASQKQYDRIRQYIQIGIKEGAELLISGLGQPDGLDKGITLSQPFLSASGTYGHCSRKIFGPVLFVLTYRDKMKQLS